ncbi:Mitochondrial Carrier (MC) Family [Thraustotheca clavata]|uniref:Mitochondrial Carrier (MC) Family n=1 Tax=Thraustotheca clavata TaxID=74557 RepID=A0A1W0A0J9_9STRA|nr:Mitochondrial Carrier (MC) Family [Thraustotheca clavata]
MDFCLIPHPHRYVHYDVRISELEMNTIDVGISVDWTAEEASILDTLLSSPKPSKADKHRVVLARYRKRKRDELLQLRCTASELEARLTHLQELHQLEDLEHPPSKWQKLANKERQREMAAMAENAQLRDLVRNQLVTAQIFAKLIAKAWEERSSTMPMDLEEDKWKSLHLVADPTLRAAGMVNILDRERANVESAFIEAGLIDVEADFQKHISKCIPDTPHEFQNVVYRHTRLPLKYVAEGVWRCIRGTAGGIPNINRHCTQFVNVDKYTSYVKGWLEHPLGRFQRRVLCKLYFDNEQVTEATQCLVVCRSIEQDDVDPYDSNQPYSNEVSWHLLEAAADGVLKEDRQWTLETMDMLETYTCMEIAVLDESKIPKKLAGIWHHIMLAVGGDSTYLNVIDAHLNATKKKLKNLGEMNMNENGALDQLFVPKFSNVVDPFPEFTENAIPVALAGFHMVFNPIVPRIIETHNMHDSIVGYAYSASTPELLALKELELQIVLGRLHNNKRTRVEDGVGHRPTLIVLSSDSLGKDHSPLHNMPISSHLPVDWGYVPHLVEFRRGNVPIVLSIPHGGASSVASILGRWQLNNLTQRSQSKTSTKRFTTFADTRTIHVGADASKAFQMLTDGCQPYLVIAKFHRKYVDVNRAPNEDAYVRDTSLSKHIYEKYHSTLLHTIQEIWLRFPMHDPLILDIHGQRAATCPFLGISNVESKQLVYLGTRNGLTIHSMHSLQQSFVGYLHEALQDKAWLGVYPLAEQDKEGYWWWEKERKEFLGGFIVRTYGFAETNANAIQLEFGASMRGADVDMHTEESKMLRQRTSEALAIAMASHVQCIDFKHSLDSDFTCQRFLQPDAKGYDVSRTAGLALFGLVYYGGPCKSLYLYFDKVMGTKPTPRTVVLQTFIDCYVHTPIFLIPSFYFITNGVKGKSIEQTTIQLKREWHTASFGSAGTGPLVNMNASRKPKESVFASSVKKSIAASSGAMMTSLFVTPLDVAKVRLQAQTSNFSTMCATSKSKTACVQHSPRITPCRSMRNPLLAAAPKAPCKFRQMTVHCVQANCHAHQPLSGTFATLRHVFHTEGLRGLYAGLPPTLMLAVPSTVLYYTSYDYMVREGKKKFPELSVIMPLLAGSSARIVAATIVSPLELVRTRMQGHGKNFQGNGMWNTLRTAVQQQGFKALYRGLNATLARDVPFSAIYWTCFEHFRSTLEAKFPESTKIEQSFGAGAMAGAIAATLTTPFDVVKTLQQVDGTMNMSTAEVLRRLIHTQGPQAIMTGLTPRLAKIVPSCAIMISSYELGKLYLGID